MRPHKSKRQSIRILSTVIYFIIFSSYSYTQNYQPFKTGYQYLYYPEELMDIECIGGCEGHLLHEIITDDYQITGEDTVITLQFEMINTSEDYYGCFMPISSWIGKKIIITKDSNCILLNAENDSIYINYTAQEGEKWILYRYKNGNQIIGEITRIELCKVFNELDSVKSIELQLYNSSGIPIDTIFDDIDIKLSKKYGSVSIINFGLFPDLYKYNRPLIELNIYEINNPDRSAKYKLKRGEIYDFTVGDEFHYIIDYDDEFHVRPQQIIKKIIDKQVTLDLDSVSYIIDRITWEEIFKSLPEPHLELVISHDTIIESYSDLNISVVEPDLSPFEIFYFPDSTYAHNYIIPIDSIKYNNRITIIYPAEEYRLSDLDNDCFVNTFRFSSRGVYRSIFIKGCGSLEYNYSYDGILRTKAEKLVYFNKGNESWGSRLYVPTYVEPGKSDSFTAYPNPNHGIFTIFLPNLSNAFYEMVIYNVSGVKIFQKMVESSSSTMQVNISQYPAGIYLIQVKSGEQIFNSSIIVY